MDIQCDACKTVYKIQDGVIPAGKKVRFTCKRCRSAGGDAPAPPSPVMPQTPPPAAAASSCGAAAAGADPERHQGPARHAPGHHGDPGADGRRGHQHPQNLRADRSRRGDCDQGAAVGQLGLLRPERQGGHHDRGPEPHRAEGAAGSGRAGGSPAPAGRPAAGVRLRGRGPLAALARGRLRVEAAGPAEGPGDQRDGLPGRADPRRRADHPGPARPRDEGRDRRIHGAGAEDLPGCRDPVFRAQPRPGGGRGLPQVEIPSP